MGKNNKHKKLLKSEKAKVKLRTKNTKQLPKGLNITDVSFKTKKILIQEQLKKQDESQILSRRKLDVKGLLTRLQHHNTKVRQEAVKELKDILSEYSPESISSPLQPLLQGVLSLSIDKEKDIRRESLKALNKILAQVSTETLFFNSNIIIPYLCFSMTNISSSIREDSLLFLDSLINNCSQLIAKNKDKILPNFLDLISRLRTESQPGRLLTTTLNSKNTSIKWTINVLSRLAKMFASIVKDEKNNRIENATSNYKEIRVDDGIFCDALFVGQNMLQPYAFNFNEDLQDSNDVINADTFLEYINELIPLMFDTWIEVSPKDKISTRFLTSEALALLENILAIIDSIIDYIEILEYESKINESNLSSTFKTKFQKAFVTRLFCDFPYIKQETDKRSNKRQNDFGHEMKDNCLEQNLVLCYIYVWFTKVQSGNKSFDALNKDVSGNIIDYLNDKLENWSNDDNAALPQLMKVLRTLFLQASNIWYKNDLSLGNLLENVLDAYLRPQNKDLQTQLFTLFSDISLERTLNKLHRDEVFKKFVSTLPPLLLNQNIHDRVIELLNNVVIRQTKWIKDYLVKNQEAIIENAKSIEIEGSNDIRESRLMICNLFYFVDGTTYY